MNKARNPTMADVAKKAGVSPSTATRVIYQNGYVSEENRRLVEEAVKATGYRPNTFARALRTQRSMTLGIVLTDAVTNPFFTRVGHAVQMEASRRGYSLVTFSRNESVAGEKEAMRKLRERDVEAIMFCHALDPDTVRAALATGVPVVQIERETLSGGWLALVDQEPGIRAAVEHLVALGHRRIAFLGGDPEHGRFPIAPEANVELQRIAAFRSAVAREGLSEAGTPIVVTEYVSDTNAVSLAGYRHGRALLARDPRPTAIVAGSDVLAAGVLQAMHEARLRAPDDISIIGYDDSISLFLSPPLTTVAQPIEDLGRTAITLAVEALEATNPTPRSETHPTRLVVRQSTGPGPAR